MSQPHGARPDVVHFYSYATGVSLELPVGFEFAGEDDASAGYVDASGDVPADSDPRVQVRSVARIEGAEPQQAVHALADGFAAVGGELLERRDRQVDDEPGCTVVLRRADDGRYVHTTAAADGDRLVTVTAIAPTPDLLPRFDAAIDSIRFVPLASPFGAAPEPAPAARTGWTDLASVDLLLSLRVPVGWDVEAADEFHLRMYRDPADAAPDGTPYRAHLGIALGEPEEAGPDWFERFCDAIPGQLGGSAPDLDLVDVERYELSSGARVLALTARQHAEGAPPTSQLLAYVWANSYRMYEVDAATLREHEARDLPDFSAILRSVRVLPSRT